MNLNRGAGQGDDRAQPGSANPGEVIDASPGPVTPGKAKGLQDTQVWKDANRGLKHAWATYRQTLIASFQSMSRGDQEITITKCSIILSMGSAALVMCFIYPFVPLLVRDVMVPAGLVAAYYAGKRVVAPILIVRFEPYMNQELEP